MMPRSGQPRPRAAATDQPFTASNTRSTPLARISGTHREIGEVVRHVRHVFQDVPGLAGNLLDCCPVHRLSAPVPLRLPRASPRRVPTIDQVVVVRVVPRARHGDGLGRAGDGPWIRGRVSRRRGRRRHGEMRQQMRWKNPLRVAYGWL